jgi:putative effector of murein hydrolase
MNNKSSHSSNPIQQRRGLSLSGLAMAAVLGVCAAAGSTAVHAQSTAGKIFGHGPAAGDTIVAKNLTTGLQREVKADSKGRYALRALPIGIYNVVLENNGKPVLQRLKVPVTAGRGVAVNFDCEKYNCVAH